MADAFEVLAYHEHKRSQSSGSAIPNRPKQNGMLRDLPEPFRTESLPSSNSTIASDVGASEPSFKTARLLNFAHATESPIDISHDCGRQFEAAQPNEPSTKASTEIVSTVMKPRVRYDVEVVTKLIVYAGTSPSRTSSVSHTLSILMTFSYKCNKAWCLPTYRDSIRKVATLSFPALAHLQGRYRFHQRICRSHRLRVYRPGRSMTNSRLLGERKS